MALHHRNRSWRPGWAEFPAVVLMGLAFACTALWFHSARSPRWERTTGYTKTAVFEQTHYNATAGATLVELNYEYRVNGQRFEGRWKGEWPAANSPNALHPEQLPRLATPGHPLQVFYHPDVPGGSRLHTMPLSGSGWFKNLAIAGFASALLYCVLVYPQSKRGRSGRRRRIALPLAVRP